MAYELPVTRAASTPVTGRDSLRLHRLHLRSNVVSERDNGRLRRQRDLLNNHFDAADLAAVVVSFPPLIVSTLALITSLVKATLSVCFRTIFGVRVRGLLSLRGYKKTVEKTLLNGILRLQVTDTLFCPIL